MSANGYKVYHKERVKISIQTAVTTQAALTKASPTVREDSSPHKVGTIKASYRMSRRKGKVYLCMKRQGICIKGNGQVTTPMAQANSHGINPADSSTMKGNSSMEGNMDMGHMNLITNGNIKGTSATISSIPRGCLSIKMERNIKGTLSMAKNMVLGFIDGQMEQFMRAHIRLI